MSLYTGLYRRPYYWPELDDLVGATTSTGPDGRVPHPESAQENDQKRVKYTSKTPFTPTYLLSTISTPENKGSSSQKATKFHEERVKRRILPLENPAREGRIKKEAMAKKKRQEEEKQRKKLGVLGRNEAVERGMWKLRKEEARYEFFIPLHQLWLGYMSELLGLAYAPTQGTASYAQTMPKAEAMHSKLIKADYNGSIMTVVRAKNPCLVGLCGIVIHETGGAFRVVTEKDQMKVIPKHNSVFSFAVPLYSTLQPTALPLAREDSMHANEQRQMETVLNAPHIRFELYGSHFQFRASERAGRKFKHKETIEL